jgi:hypothetical protein
MTYQLLAPPSALASIVSNPPAAASYGDIWGDDGIGMRYRFTVYDIDVVTYGVNGGAKSGQCGGAKPGH